MLTENKFPPVDLNAWIANADFDEIIPFIHRNKELFQVREENEPFLLTLAQFVEHSRHKDILEPWFQQILFPEIYNIGFQVAQRLVLKEDTERLKKLFSNPRVFSLRASFLNFKVQDLFLWALEKKKLKSIELMLRYGVYVPLSRADLESLCFDVKPIVKKYYQKREVFGGTLPAVIQCAVGIGNISSIDYFIKENPDWNEFTGSIGYNLVDLSLFAEREEMTSFLRSRGGIETNKYLQELSGGNDKNGGEEPTGELPETKGQGKRVSAGKIKSPEPETIPALPPIPESPFGETGNGNPEKGKKNTGDEIGLTEVPVVQGNLKIPPSPFGTEGVKVPSGEGEEPKGNARSPRSEIISCPPPLPASPFGTEGILTPIEGEKKSFESAISDMPITQEAKELFLAWRSHEESEEDLERRFGHLLVERGKLLYEIMNEYFSRTER